MNKVIIIGNLTKDPEIRSTKTSNLRTQTESMKRISYLL